MKINNQIVIIISIISLASCKQTKYIEFGGGIGGTFSSYKSEINNNKAAKQLNPNSVSENDSFIPPESSQWKTKTPLNQAESIHRKPKSGNKSLNRFEKQTVKKLIYSFKLPKKRQKANTKNKKQIFGYQGGNDAMTIGLNILIYGSLALIAGLILVFGLGFINILKYLGYILYSLGIVGIFGGALTWFIGWLFDNDLEVIAYIIFGLFGLAILGILALIFSY